MRKFDEYIIIGIMIGVVLLGGSGCGTEKTNIEYSVEKNTESLTNILQQELDYENVVQIALNNEENVLIEKEDLEKIYAILKKMQLEEWGGEDNELKAGFLRLILSYEDKSTKNIYITANKAVSIDELAYEVVNYEETVTKITELFDEK